MSFPEKKVKHLKRLKQLLEEKESFFLSHLSHVNVHVQNELRSKIKEQNAISILVKNNLFRKALLEKKEIKDKVAAVIDDLKGVIHVAFAGDEFSSVAKLLLEYSKNENFQYRLKSAFFDGSYIALEEVKDLANLPSRQELLVLVARGIQEPVAQIGRGIQEMLNSVGRGVKAVAELKANEG